MSLTAASEQRKERLALLQGAKRKRGDITSTATQLDTNATSNVMQYRNYDPDSQAPKLGFLHNPVQADVETMESRAQDLEKDLMRTNAPLDNDASQYEAQDFRAKGAHWDLKRDLLSKLEQLKPQQEAIIAKYVRDKITNSKDPRTK